MKVRHCLGTVKHSSCSRFDCLPSRRYMYAFRFPTMRIRRWNSAALVLACGCRAAAFAPDSRGYRHTTSIGAINGEQPTEANDIDSFDAFVRMRLGLDATCAADPSDSTSSSAESRSASALPPAPGVSPTVYWVGSGELYQAFSGKILAKFEGFDAGRGYVVTPGHVRQLSRKIFWFRDPDTLEIMTEYEGQEVKPIRYDYQVFDYRRSDVGAEGQPLQQADMSSVGMPLQPILPSVVSGPRDVPVMPVTAQTAGRDRLQFQAPVFVDIDIPNVGPYQAWEFYDYTVDTTYPEDQPPVAVWCRQGSNPPFVRDGSGVMRFVGHRVDCFDDLPESIKELVEGEGGECYNIFREPPVDMDEVEMLQRKQNVRR